MSLSNLIKRGEEQREGDVIALALSHLFDSETKLLYELLRGAYPDQLVPVVKSTVPGGVRDITPVVRELAKAVGMAERGSFVVLALLGLVWIVSDKDKMVSLSELEDAFVRKGLLDPEAVRAGIAALKEAAPAAEGGLVTTNIAISAIPQLFSLIAAQRTALEQVLSE